GEVAALALVPRVVDAVAPRPVAAAGGIADARGVVAVLALGAQAAVLGTRFLASAESRAHPRYKQEVLEAGEGDTVRTILFGHGWPNAPHRTLRTVFVEQWLGREARGQESRPDEPAVGPTVIGGQAMPVLGFMGVPPEGEGEGGIAAVALLGGPGRGPGPRDQAGRSDRSRAGRGGAADHCAALARPGTAGVSRRTGSHEAGSPFYIPLAERPSRAAEASHVEETGREGRGHHR